MVLTPHHTLLLQTKYPPRQGMDIFLYQLNDRHLRGTSATRADLVNSCITAVSVSILGSDLVKHLLGYVLLCDVGQNLTLCVQGVCLLQRREWSKTHAERRRFFLCII